jgi:hypothetical protein
MPVKIFYKKWQKEKCASAHPINQGRSFGGTALFFSPLIDARERFLH